MTTVNRIRAAGKSRSHPSYNGGCFEGRGGCSDDYQQNRHVDVSYTVQYNTASTCSVLTQMWGSMWPKVRMKFLHHCMRAYAASEFVCDATMRNGQEVSEVFMKRTRLNAVCVPFVRCFVFSSVSGFTVVFSERRVDDFDHVFELALA